jgi:hypothetical protein
MFFFKAADLNCDQLAGYVKPLRQIDDRRIRRLQRSEASLDLLQ